MLNLLAALFRAPWWVFVGLAVLIYFGGDYMYQDMKAEKEARLAAMKGPVPEVVDLSDFSDRDIPVSDEVHLKGWVNFDLNHHLTVTKKGRVRDERYVFVLFGSDDAFGSKIARAALFFSRAEREQFIAQMDQYITGYDRARPLIQVNGFGGEYESFEDQLGGALAKLDVKLGPDFIAIHPFLDGREKGLNTGGNPDSFKGFGLNAALVLLAVAGLKFFLRLGRRKSNSAFDDSPIASSNSFAALTPQPTGTTTGTEMPHDLGRAQPVGMPRAEAITDDSPLGRMLKRDQALQVQAEESAPSGFAAEFGRKQSRQTSGLWQAFKKSSAFILTAAILLIWAGRKLRIVDLGDAGDIMRWAVTAMVLLCIGFGAWVLTTREDFAGGNPTVKIAAGVGGLFLLGQVQGVLGAPAGGALLTALLPLAGLFLLWTFVIRRFTQAVGRGVDKAAAAAVKAKMSADPFEKLARENAGPIQSTR